MCVTPRLWQELVGVVGIKSLSGTHFYRSHLQLSQNGYFACRTNRGFDQASVEGFLCRLACGQQCAERPDSWYPGEGLSIVSRQWPMIGEQIDVVAARSGSVTHIVGGGTPIFQSSCGNLMYADQWLVVCLDRKVKSKSRVVFANFEFS